MRHLGTVLDTDGHLARVKLTGAEKCSSCGACGSTSELRRTPEIQVKNLVRAQPGEQVWVEFDPAQTIRSGALVFMVPILGLLGGAVAGNLLGGTEASTLLGAVGALGLSVLGIAFYDRRLARDNPTPPRAVERFAPCPEHESSRGEQGDSGVVQGLLRR